MGSYNPVTRFAKGASMRLPIAMLLLLFAPWSQAQPVIKVTQVAEIAGVLSQPHDAAFSPDGKQLYVTDMRNSRIQVLDAMTLKPMGVLGTGELAYPHDAEFDAAGRLLVADTGNDRIAIIAAQGAHWRRVGELKGLSGPEGVAVMADGRVVATSTGAGQVVLFREGRQERVVGRHGSRDGEFIRPHDVDVSPDGRIYVVDSGNNRVQVFDGELRHLSSFGAELGLNEPKYLAFDGDRLWLADEYNHRILLLDRQHKLLGVLGTGSRGRAPNAFHKPEAVLARWPHVWVIDTYNDRVVLLKVQE
jgi:DNA-binding beta-propeller fold protein YncE